MTDVYISTDNIITSLGFTTRENLDNLEKNKTGIRICSDKKISQTPFYTSLVDSERLHSGFKELDDTGKFTRLEKMFILSITDALKNTKVSIQDKKTLMIISTTKGNIDLLEPESKNEFDHSRAYLWETANLLQKYFQNPNKPVVISNSCISGVLAIITGARLIRSLQYENVIISGGDIVSRFVISGFNSLMALSPEPCMPYDLSRNGLTLGEGCGTIILTSNREFLPDNDMVIVAGGSTSNDANHISGPSRSGDGLFLAVKNTLREAKLNFLPLESLKATVFQGGKEVEYISAHGTATVYNDEMESKAFCLAGLERIPLNSFKGYFGHTLGAAGVIESIAAIHSLKENKLFNTKGFNELGVSKKINVIKKSEKRNLNNCLKTASGFGGCNAAVLFSKKSLNR